MKNSFYLLAGILILACISKPCNAQSGPGNHKSKLAEKAPVDSLAKDNTEPSFEEVLADLRAAYNKVEHIDKTVIDGRDTLQLHETYYCLHHSYLTVPKKYMIPWGIKNPTDFVAHTFVSKIIVINNRDTVLNKIFKKADFHEVLWDPLQQYAVIFTADYIGYDKTTGEFAMGYSITIPSTDVGLGAGIAVSKNGKYRILDEYANTDSFKKD